MNKKSIQEIKNKIPELPNSYFNPFPFSFIVNMKHTQSENINKIKRAYFPIILYIKKFTYHIPFEQDKKGVNLLLYKI